MSAELKPDVKEPKLKVVNNRPEGVTSRLQIVDSSPIPTSADIFVGKSCPVDFTFPREEIVDQRKKLLARIAPQDNTESKDEDLAPYTSHREDAPPPRLVKELTEIYLSTHNSFVDMGVRNGFSHEDSRNFVNDMYIKAYNNLHNYRQNNMSAWMYRILTNTIFDAGRRRQRIRMIDGESADNHMRGVTNGEGSHDERLLQKERVETFYAKLARLSSRDQRAIRLVYFEQRKLEEAGSELGASRYAMKSILFRARAHLRNDDELRELVTG